MQGIRRTMSNGSHTVSLAASLGQGLSLLLFRSGVFASMVAVCYCACKGGTELKVVNL